MSQDLDTVTFSLPSPTATAYMPNCTTSSLVSATKHLTVVQFLLKLDPDNGATIVLSQEDWSEETWAILVLSGGKSNSKTFKTRKDIPDNSYQQDLLEKASVTLGSGDLRQAVKLPDGENLNEWIAVNTVDFFNQINMLYGTLIDYCTEETCPVMCASPKYEYHWADGQTIKRPIKCSAPRYVDYLMAWVQDQLDNETVFPSKIGVAFPRNFMSITKTILKRLFRVYAHIYHQHFTEVCKLQEEPHLNTSFKHFIFFVHEFELVDRKELAPLQELIDRINASGKTKVMGVDQDMKSNASNFHSDSSRPPISHQPTISNSANIHIDG